MTSVTSGQAAASAATTAKVMRRGAFIVVEGLDRAGKSTQVARLAQALSAKAIKFPERTTPIGKMIDAYLAQRSEMDDRAIHLLFSANRWEASQSVLALLEQGQNVVCDRYAFSGIAYSCAKGLRYDWCRSPDVGLPSPDLTLFLSLSPDMAAQRGGYGEERYEALAMQTKVRQVFTQLGTDPSIGRWRTIDAGQDIDKVAQDCLSEAQQTIRSLHETDSPVDTLFT